ncbi:MAG: mandelate racemase/muconate lactonizing enzyme family protein [Pirellulales bacterium]
MQLTVKKIERIWVDVPYRPVPKRNMVRELPHWTIFELCKVTLECGVTGVGETMQFYTWGNTTDDAVNRAQGRQATEIMWDDTLGAGLQMALFDAVGRAMDVPVWQLLGQKVRDEAPISWWSIDLPPADWLEECRAALAAGYTSYKFKARPWFDLDEQLRTVTREMPAHFDIDLDFNTMLNDSAHAVRVLREMEKYPQVKIYESPIPQGDVPGNKYLRQQTCIPIAMHVGNPPLATALQEDVCDGFVVCCGVSQALHEAHVIAQWNKVFWLQLVGTGLTATLALHLAAVCSHARWPAVNCHNLYEHTLLKQPIAMRNGHAPIPMGPGLGVEVDWDAVERFRIEPIFKPYPAADLLMRLSWPSGAEDYYCHGLQYWDDFIGGRKPVFSPGVNLEVVPNDGTAEWRKLREETLKKPWWVSRPN